MPKLTVNGVVERLEMYLDNPLFEQTQEQLHVKTDDRLHVQVRIPIRDHLDREFDNAVTNRLIGGLNALHRCSQ